jgi:hypothetical protein
VSHKIDLMVIVIAEQAWPAAPTLERTSASEGVGRALAADIGWPYVETEHVRPIVARVLERREHAVISAPPLSEPEERALAHEMRPVRFVHLDSAAAAAAAGDTLAPLVLDASLPREQLLRRIRDEFGV